MASPLECPADYGVKQPMAPSHPQRRIGLTGGIATGKSSVGRWLSQQGLPVLDADVFAREALAAGSPGARAVLARYGEQVRAAGLHPAEGVAVDRAALGRIVFSNPSERRWLEQLVHPIVQARFKQELIRLQQTPTVVLMIPLLFEAGLEALCTETWLVDCSPQHQQERLIIRDGLSAADARARIAAQWSLDRKRQLVDVVIDNDGGPNAWTPQLERVLQSKTAPKPS